MPEGDEHEGVEEPAKEAWFGGEVELLGEGGSFRGVLVSDAGGEGLKEGRGVDHFDGGDLPGVKGEVFSLNSDDAEEGFADAE